MIKAIFVLILMFSIIMLNMAYANDASTDPADIVDNAVNSDGDVSGVIGDVGKLVKTVKDLKSGEHAGELVAWMALLAAIFKLLISLLKMASTWFKEKGKNYIRIATLVLGGGLFIVLTIGAGKEWWEALILALSGPMSLAIHEITKLVKPNPVKSSTTFD
jgi:hypothetical protein